MQIKIITWVVKNITTNIVYLTLSFCHNVSTSTSGLVFILGARDFPTKGSINLSRASFSRAISIITKLFTSWICFPHLFENYNVKSVHCKKTRINTLKCPYITFRMPLFLGRVGSSISSESSLSSAMHSKT